MRYLQTADGGRALLMMARPAHAAPCPALQFCADIEPGHSRAIVCLEQHRAEPNFSRSCRVEIEALMIARATDFRLDPQLRRACKNDVIVRLLPWSLRLSVTPGYYG